MKILITGGKGMLARALIKRLQSRHEVVITGREEMDVEKTAEVFAVAGDIRPETILHCGAWTHVDACESDPQKAFRINAWGARNVAAAALKYGADLIYFSSDYVFDGTSKEPYREHDAKNPLNVYGRSKSFGEEAVAGIVARHVIIRISGLFGVGGACFPETILRKARLGERLDVVSDQILAPTYAPHVAEGVDRLLGSGLYGIYHLTSDGATTWFDFAQEILKLSGLAETRLHPLNTMESHRPAERPRYSVLDTSNFRHTFSWSPPSWRAGLREYLGELAES
ncbi:MAG: dTDP-4-dehydrorhamnose reductase [Candidatus Eisenbacteria bacterium]|uniref:dTDP-4-dehydrorhamnose reductase n=1 Tax=Eiseniibacteriota bacterium TaxID=2212470 RepID=A0A948W546_UNCEI|nr:dTDP-4-dehydrorhamnose reductase [Candidatus Eisenbacteria bacterium]MBU1950651.1 dTDP-4-dehydrorhamnose reductase [Candidatus Eisenbacteria bacterium]MBU2689650.1 dTDP-4-dehydrorhamnose reductase [Candidatus Eisenbacteria bacterium]